MLFKTPVFGVARCFGPKDQTVFSCNTCLLFALSLSLSAFLVGTHSRREVTTQFTVCKAKIVSIWHEAEVAKAYSQPSHIRPEIIPPLISYP